MEKDPNAPVTGGFTLLEMLVVLTIASIFLASFSNDVASILPGRQLRAAVHNLADALRSSREEALRMASEQSIAIDPVGNFWRDASRNEHHLPSGVRLSVLKTSWLGGKTSNQLTFFDDGSSSGGEILLEQGDRSFHIHVDWITGKVRLDDNY